MPDETSERQEMQDRIVQSMKDFAAENPSIAEAMAVMNVTMPDYYRAMESIRGGQIITASAYVALPLQAQENS
ncbi:MAG: hypothetical protein WB579_23100 [Bryobacteraceae bacterium]